MLSFAPLLRQRVAPRKAAGVGGRFYARRDRTNNGLRAYYRLLDGNGVLAAINARLFGSDREARDRLHEKARRSGFQSISVEFGKESD